MAQTDSEAAAQRSPRLFVGGVGQLYQADMDAGRVVVERLQADQLGGDVIAEDLYYGAIAVCQRLQELQPKTLLLVGAANRGRAPGTVTCFEVAHLTRSPTEFRQAVAEAATGYVSIELILEVASAFGALPERTVVIEIEPRTAEPGDNLSTEVEGAVEKALELVRLEISRLAVLS